MSHPLWQLMRRTDRVVHRVRQRELQEYGLSTETASTIFAIVRLGLQATTKAIAMQRFLERNSISEHLTRMQKQGLVEKVIDPDRKNRVRVILTPNGHEAFARSVIRRSMGNVMSALSSQEQRHMWLLLARLRSKALSDLEMEAGDVYPPSDPDLLLETVEGKAIADRGHALYQLIRLTVRIIYKARQRELEEYGISLEISSALSAIDRLGQHATPKMIAEQRFLERNTASDQLTRLERQGFVQKVRDLGRKNRVRVTLTEKGQEALSRAMIRRSITSVMSVLERGEQEELWFLLSKLRARALEQLEKEASLSYPPSDPERLPADMTAHVSPESP